MATPPSNGDTIYALSSGAPPAALAIVRISGPAAATVLEEMASSRGVDRRASLRTLRAIDGQPLDRAVTLFFPGPGTATGEALAELHLHGGRAVVDAVLKDLAARGLRLAEPGEFTRRALLNGRLDLTEVEGLADLLAAETEAQRRDALARSEGLLRRKLDGWNAALLDVAAMIEALIDYDDDVDVRTGVQWRSAAAKLSAEMGQQLDVPPAERLRDGLRIVIAGPPNAGKSTLFNALIGQDAAIVSPLAGTTRDSIERPVAIGGLPFVFVDTAGIRSTSDVIEALGVDRTHREVMRADIVIALDNRVYGDGACIRVAAKSDQRTGAAIAGALAVSAKTGSGLAELIAAITEAGRQLIPREGEVSLDQRCRAEVSLAREALDAALSCDDLLLAAEHLRAARHALDRLTGRAGVDDMLDALFGRFCLGK